MLTEQIRIQPRWPGESCSTFSGILFFSFLSSKWLSVQNSKMDECLWNSTDHVLPWTKKKNHHRDSRREERCFTCDIRLDQARSTQAKSDPRLSATFALRWSRLIEHDITGGTAFFSPRISRMVLFFVQGRNYLNAILSDGVECVFQLFWRASQWSDRNWQGQLPLTWLFLLFGKRDASKDTDRSWNHKKNPRLEKKSSDHLLPPWPSDFSLAGPPIKATQPCSTCVQAHSGSLRIHFTAEFAPFFHSREVNS